MNNRIVSTVEELDDILLELDAAAKISDDELRRCFTTFSMEYPVNVEQDPYSSDYKAAQSALYERLSGKTYTPENEVSAFDVDKAVNQPFPLFFIGTFVVTQLRQGVCQVSDSIGVVGFQRYGLP